MFALVFQSSAKIMIRGKGSIKEGKIHNVRCDVPFFPYPCMICFLISMCVYLNVL